MVSCIPSLFLRAGLGIARRWAFFTLAPALPRVGRITSDVARGTGGTDFATVGHISRRVLLTELRHPDECGRVGRVVVGGCVGGSILPATAIGRVKLPK